MPFPNPAILAAIEAAHRNNEVSVPVEIHRRQYPCPFCKELHEAATTTFGVPMVACPMAPPGVMYLGKPDIMAWPREHRLHPTPSHFDPEVRLVDGDYVEPVVPPRARERAAVDEQAWASCTFNGPPPTGYRSWSDWCASPRKSNVTLRAT